MNLLFEVVIQVLTLNFVIRVRLVVVDNCVLL
jgi:hypothetical protein